MNVFVLTTGRSGSLAFTQACSHIENFSASHESRVRIPGPTRLDYPTRHIEVDNRLAWFLGRLDEKYGRDAYYVHLMRDPQKVAASLLARWDYYGTIGPPYRDGVYMGTWEPREATCADYVETINANIRSFLKDKPNWMPFHLEAVERDFPIFWEWIGAKGDYETAAGEWANGHHASASIPLRDHLRRVRRGKWRRLTRTLFGI